MTASGARRRAVSRIAPAARLPRVSFLYVGNEAGAWQPGPAGGVARRDLGGATATDGFLDAWDVRAAPGADRGEWLARDVDFHAFFVARGSVRVEGEDDADLTLGVGDVACFPRLYRHRLTTTPDLRLLEIATPAGGASVTTPEAAAEGPPLVHREAADAYDVGVSPTASRRFLAYRDIPVPAAVEGRIRLEVIRAHIGGHSSGWHHHPMAQIVFAIQGRAFVDVDGHGTKELEPGTAIYLPPGLPHNLREISDDYGLFEAFVPGIGGSTQCDAPAGWAEEFA